MDTAILRNGTPPAAGRRSAFTLVEILVVIAIIAILGGLTVAGLQLAQEEGHIGAERHTIAMLRSNIGQFALELGDYPPTSLKTFGVKGNDINEGNESLFACLQTRKRNGPFLDDIDESRWQNYDGDKLSSAEVQKIKAELDWVRGGDRLLEYTDYWGNPYVYIHSSDYKKKFRYQGVDGTVFEVEAAKSDKTGGYAAPTSYQLWSLGPDGVNQNGGGDDICSWKS